MSRLRPYGSYGTDAPWVPWLWLAIGVLYVVLAVCGIVWWNVSAWGNAIVAIVAVVFVAGAGVYWHTTLRGKFAVWRDILEQPRPPSRVLDMGCGRGAVAIMTALPSPDAAFELVTASMSIHNIHSAAGRARAIDQAGHLTRGARQPSRGAIGTQSGYFVPDRHPRTCASSAAAPTAAHASGSTRPSSAVRPRSRGGTTSPPAGSVRPPTAPAPRPGDGRGRSCASRSADQ
ncbi:hypothetical protein [Microbacterium elymi]|uniref:Uncharacterized protein n=1 Tax=Microbacterium elymi TaxID=2909587 RepID=A0ABY5NJS1_9MICO|nr:hypothetical protein [Microbacterium elymi]UUT35415.1 hypothetical protein L2X98_18585 [Microbacterium elymi]